jgi:6,7-dimethyl-8-ribityllumazine synthase
MLRNEFIAGEPQDASKLRVGVVVARFNSDITDALLAGARETLAAWKVKEKNIRVVHVPGSFEIPLAVARIAKTKRYDCIVALGCVIKGETKHDEYISAAVSNGLMRVMLDTGVPVSFGILTPNSVEQARVRSSGETNHGASAVRAALEMALVN